jgi:hypothetical protein
MKRAARNKTTICVGLKSGAQLRHNCGGLNGKGDLRPHTRYKMYCSYVPYWFKQGRPVDLVTRITTRQTFALLFYKLVLISGNHTAAHS